MKTYTTDEMIIVLSKIDFDITFLFVSFVLLNI